MVRTMIFRYEFHKVLSQKKLVLFLLGLIVVNLISFAYYENMNVTVPLHAYSQFNQDIQSISNSKRYDYIEKEYEKYNAFLLIEQISQLSIHQEENQYMINDIQNDYPYIEQYKDEYQHGYTLKYASSLESEVHFLESIKDEWNALYQYPQYLENIENKAQTIQNISIFQQEDNSNVIKTAKDYQALKNVTITYELEKGVKDAISFPLTSYFLLIGIFVVSSFLIIEEKDKRLFLLIKTTLKGQYQTILAKCMVIIVIVAVMSLLMILSQLWYMHIHIGLGDLTRSIQSLRSYLYSSFQWNVIELIVGIVCLKYFTICCIGLLMMLLMIVFQHKIYVMMIVMGIGVIEFILSLVISPLSSLYLWKYINFISFMQPEIFFQIYKNVLLGNQLILLQNIAWIVISVLLMMLFIMCIVIYIYQKEYQIPSFYLIFQRERHISLSLFKQEIYKCLWVQKVFFLIIISSMILGYQYMSLTIPQEMDIIVYQGYMEVLNGKLTKEKEIYIEKEKQRYEDLHQKLEDFIQQEKEGKISQIQRINMSESIEQQIMYEHVFNQIIEQYQIIQENPSMDFVFSYPYEQMFFETKWTFIPILLLLFISILSTSSIITYEYQNQCYSLMKTTQHGHHKTITYKLLLSVGLVIILFIITQLPTVLLFMKTYGFSSLSSSAISIGCLLPKEVTILGAWILHVFIQLLAILIVVMVGHGIVIYTKNFNLSLFIIMLVFFVPMLLSYGGIHFLDCVSLYPLLMNGIYVLEQTKLLHLGISLLGYSLLLISSIKYIYKKY